MPIGPPPTTTSERTGSRKSNSGLVGEVGHGVEAGDWRDRGTANRSAITNVFAVSRRPFDFECHAAKRTVRRRTDVDAKTAEAFPGCHGLDLRDHITHALHHSRNVRGRVTRCSSAPALRMCAFHCATRARS